VLPWRVKLCDPHGVFIQRNSDVLHDVGIDSTQGFAGATSKVWIEWRQGVTATDSGRAAVGCVDGEARSAISAALSVMIKAASSITGLVLSEC